jgi:hypothetical protein
LAGCWIRQEAFLVRLRAELWQEYPDKSKKEDRMVLELDTPENAMGLETEVPPPFRLKRMVDLMHEKYTVRRP